MKIFVTGDSHTAALKTGADLLISQGDVPQDCQIDVQQLGGGISMTTPFFIDRGDFAEMTHEKHLRRIKRLPFADEQQYYDWYGICGPLHATRIWRNKDYWQNYTPFTPEGGQAPVSASLLRHVVVQEQHYTMQLLELLKRVGVKVFVIEAPKPYKHHPILELVNQDIIAYVDEFYRKVMREWLASKDVPVIDVPGACYDADGFMHEAYRHDNPADGYHANKQFGAVMISEIIGFAKSIS